MVFIFIRAGFRNFCLFWLFLTVPVVYAAVPIQGGSLHGAGVVDARLRLISAAETFLGTPYRYAGLDRNGLDCSGFVHVSFREALNVLIPRSSDGIYDWVEKIPTNELQPGDLVFFVTSGQRVSHLGIYAGGGMFIHAASEGPQTGVMYSHLEESYWKRTYHGAGRALPWDDEAAQVMAKKPIASSKSAAANNPAEAAYYSSNSSNSNLPAAWADPGFFAGFGLAWNWGGFIEGAPSVFRGFSTMATIGYKWTKYRIGFELRPGWDRALGVFRLPVTLSVGTDYFQVFGGPAVTLGNPSLSLDDGERYYSGSEKWLWELGTSFSMPFWRIESGALAVYGDLAWQPYHWEEGKFSFKPDFTANLRLSTGFRYFWHL